MSKVKVFNLTESVENAVELSIKGLWRSYLDKEIEFEDLMYQRDELDLLLESVSSKYRVYDDSDNGLALATG